MVGRLMDGVDWLARQVASPPRFKDGGSDLYLIENPNALDANNLKRRWV